MGQKNILSFKKIYIYAYTHSRIIFTNRCLLPFSFQKTISEALREE